MNSISDTQAIEYLSKCENYIHASLDETQLEQLCNGLIDVFYEYIEGIQNFKSEVNLQKLQLHDEIDMLKNKIFKLQAQIDEQNNDLYRQIELCQQLEKELQNIEKQAERNCNEIQMVETELRKKLHQQNSEYRSQIQTLISAQQVIDEDVLQLKKDKSNIQLKYDQLLNLYEDQQQLIEELNERINQSTHESPNQVDRNCKCDNEISEHSFEVVKDKKENLYYSNCPSHNQINFKWEKIQPSISTIKNSYTLLIAPSNSKFDLSSKRRIKSLLEVNDSKPKCDPYYEFFKLLTQCVKLNLGRIEYFTLNLDHLFEQFKQRNVPFNRWYEKIKQEIKK